MLRHCQQVSDEIWPALELPETNGGESWQTGFDGLETMYVFETRYSWLFVMLLIL